MPDLSGRLLGKYRILKPIGQGGMATVFLARDEEQWRNVALKLLSPLIAENETFLLRFRREAKVVMRLRHPNIVPLEDSGEVDGYAFMTMPYFDAGSLADRLRLAGLSPAESQRMIGQIAGALQYAHDEGVIHRDVKPSNILLDSQGNALLSDFGLAQIQDASMSLTGSAMLGTPAYVSPEQARGEPVDARTDQYSLGILLFRITTGRLPFEADTPLAVLGKQANEPLPSPRSFSPNLPEAVERVILRSTAKKPDDRFPTVAEMNLAFQQAMAHALDPSRNRAPTIRLPPVRSAPEPDGRSPGSRRRRILVSGIVGALLLVAASAAALQGLAPGMLSGNRDAAQLTALQGTIAALSTDVAESGGALSPEVIGSSVAFTLTAAPTATQPSATSTQQPSPTPTSTRKPTSTPTAPAPAPTQRPTRDSILPLPTLPF